VIGEDLEVELVKGRDVHSGAVHDVLAVRVGLDQFVFPVVAIAGDDES
jgi:hypothetical protein